MSQLHLQPGEAHVLCASLELPQRRLDDLAATLSAEETERAARFRFPRDRHRFIARRGLLREVLGRLAQVQPRRLRFSAGPFGKPALTAPVAGRPMHFSLAHSDVMAALALSCEAELGVDIERIRALPDLPGLVATIGSENEQRQWERLPEPERLEAFFNLWTRKEAFLKAIGLGLNKPPREIEVPLRRCGPEESLRVLDGAREVPDWSVRSLSTPGFILALALRNPATHVRCWEWSPWADSASQGSSTTWPTASGREARKPAKGGGLGLISISTCITGI